MIIIHDLISGYGQHKVIDRVNWSLENGMIHGLVGLNGSGKTTLLKTIFGLIKPEAGTIMMDNHPLTKKSVSFLETESYFYHGINGREYLSLFRQDEGMTFNSGEWASLFHLSLDELVDNYSTGMKKKLALLAIIKMNQPVILLDEPFNGLDMESSRILTAILKRIKQDGKTIVITSHMLESLHIMCDRIHYLKNGTINKTYKPGEFLQMNQEIFHELDRSIENKIEGLMSEVQKQEKGPEGF